MFRCQRAHAVLDGHAWSYLAGVRELRYSWFRRIKDAAVGQHVNHDHGLFLCRHSDGHLGGPNSFFWRLLSIDDHSPVNHNFGLSHS